MTGEPFVLLAGIANAEADAAVLPGIKKLNDLKPNASVFRAASRDKPLVLLSEKDAGKYFAKDDLAKLVRQTDFKQQFVLVFRPQDL